MYKFYLQLNEFKKTIIGITTLRQQKECGMVRSALCRLVAVLLLSVGAFSYAQADDWTGSLGGTSITGAGIAGSGAKDDPYIINSAAKLATVAYLSANNPKATSNKHFSLTVDVDLKNIEWTFGEGKTNGFRGVLNGNGHTISNLRLIGSSSEGNGDDKGYGLFSHIGEGNSTTPAKVINLILSSPSLTINSAGTGRRYYGILAGRMYNYAIVENVKILNPTITFACNHNAQWNVGAGIGYIGVYAHVKNILVTSPTITTSGSLTVAKTTRFSIGGAIGFLDGSGTGVNNGFLQANYADHIVVTNGNIDLSGYTPASKSGNLYNLRYDYFYVGGVIGAHKNPEKICENLFFSGKIKSQYSIVAPCVGVLNAGEDTQMLSQQFSGEGYTGKTYDMVEGSKSSTWYYNNFKIGLDATAISAAESDGKLKNYHSSNVDGDGYLNVTPSTLKRHNRVEATPRQSYSVLWWTRNNNTNTASVAPADSTDWTDGEQCIYPRYDKDVVQYPLYYMYYAQGVNGGTQYLSNAAATTFVAGVTKNIDNAMGANTPKDITLTITDTNKGKRGFDKHTFTVSAEGNDVGDIRSYKWYVNGVDEGAGNTKDVTPTFDKTRGYQLGSGILVYAYDSSDNILAQAASDLPVARLRFKDSDGAGTKSEGPHTYVYDAGTKDHPYLIGCENDLRLLSEHIRQNSNFAQEYIYFSNGLNSNKKCRYNSVVGNRNDFISYNQAYYEMDADVELSSTPFQPIGPIAAPIPSNDGTDGAYNNNFTFMGSFDGKGHTIKGLRQTWYAGYINIKDARYAWGLFSTIGSPNAYYKVGETATSNAAVRNLIIEDAVLTHKTTNTSFYYNNGSGSSSGNSCYVGPLVGIAGNNATIENISVVNSSITDDGSSTYYLAAHRLSVGGVIGRATAGITNDNGTLDNTTLRYLSSDTEIDLQHAEFYNLTNASQTQLFNIGGIVGSIHSNGVQNTVPFPKPAYYGGIIRARNAIAGPIFGYVSWSNGNNGSGYLDFARHFTAKTSNTGDFDATGMYYSADHADNSITAGLRGFHIYDGSTYKAINDTYPEVTTDWGDRNIKGISSHTNTNVYTESTKDLYEYQGVNQGNYKDLGSSDITDAFNDYSSLLTDEQTLLKDHTWNWSNVGNGGQPVVTIGEASGFIVTAKDTYEGSTVTDPHTLEATVTGAETTPTYQWVLKTRTQENGVWKNDTIEIDDPDHGSNTATYIARPNIHNQYIMVRVTVDEDVAYSEPLFIPSNQTFSANITKSDGDFPKTISVTVSPAAATLTPENFTVSYQWYKGNIGSGTPLSGETGASLTVSAGDDEQTLRYCVISIADSTAHSDYRADNIYYITKSKLPADAKIIFLDPSNRTGEADDDNPGTDIAPVKSWHKAYSLLTDGGTWDDNKIVLMSQSNFERTKEGFMICGSDRQGNTGNATTWYNEVWDKKDTHAAEGYQSGLQNKVMWKNVTITGYLDSDHDYHNEAQLTFSGSSEWGIGLFGDTKFEHLTFVGGNTYNILYCHYYDLEMGDGVVTKGMRYDDSYGSVKNAQVHDFQIFGGYLNDRRFRDDTNGFRYDYMEGNITSAQVGETANGKPWLPHGKEGFTITVKSGHYSVICSSYRQNNDNSTDHGQGMIGTPNMPLKCTINIDINRTFNDDHANIISNNNGTAHYDVGLILAGNHEGAMYGNVDINVYSGYVGRIASGTLGNLRPSNAHWWAGHYMPFNAFMGRANILLDPSLSRFAAANETSETKNSRIIITEMYGGGVGRSLGTTSGMISIPFYGHTSITMNGGTFTVLPAGNNTTEIFPGIYATGAGGVNGMYHVAGETVSDYSAQRLPFWVTNSSGQVDYGTWDTYKTKTGAEKVYIKCYDDYDASGDSIRYTLIDPEDAKTTVLINGGVFGSSDKPIDGIYGGGSGYTPVVWMKNSDAAYPNYRSGNIYGKEDADHPVASLTINGGEFYLKNGVFAGGRGTDYYYKTYRHSGGSGSSSNPEWYGNYTALGQIYGNVELNITGGHFHDNGSTYSGNIYGGGLGFGDVRYNNSGDYKTLKDMARVYGTTTVNISGGTFEGNIYGGGAIANVGYGGSDNARITPEIQHYGTSNKSAVTLNITGGRITGSVFGGAEGKTNVEVTEAPDSIGNVFGNVDLTIKGDTIGGDIYGGGEKGDVYGNAVTQVSDAKIAGNIYGGGLGVLSGGTVTASADVTGSTNVTLGTGTSYVALSGGNYVPDNSTEHFLYGGGNYASVIGKYTGSPVTAVVSGGNTTVNVNNGMGTNQLTVFGGGYGVNTACNMATVNINNFNTDKNGKPLIGLKEVYGGGNEGKVYTNTNVFMNGGQVLGDVFGGGNIAEVGTLLTDAKVTAHTYENYGTTVSLANANAYVYGNIYGGGNKANVRGISQVNISMGQFAGEIFGGGKGYMTDENHVGTAANIIGQTKVFVNGALAIWDKLWNGSSFLEWSGTPSGKNWSSFIEKEGTGSNQVITFKNPHNIFGGGYLACAVSDTAFVEVTNGVVSAGLIKTDVWKKSFRDNANPHFYVFGGGYGPFTQVANTDVTVGVEGYFSDDDDESTNEQWSLDLPFEGENRETAADNDSEMHIYGNSYGIGGYTVLGVIGGGYAGLVKENTNVKLGGTTFVHRVYGGGYGQLAAFNKLGSGTDITAYTGNIITGKNRENLGEVGGNTRVTVSLSKPDAKGRTGGVYGDVFGGGAGVESAIPDGGSFRDFADMAKVLGVTRVDITENARVYGNVYGGGDVGNVVNTVANADSVTVVKVRGGDVFGNVFGAGKGRIRSVCSNSTSETPGYLNIGNVQGNTYVIVSDSVATAEIDGEETEYTIVPNIWGSIYGGGEVGNVKQTSTSEGGNTDIYIEGGNVGNDIFGGGYGDIQNIGDEGINEDNYMSSADVAGNSNIEIDGGSFLWERISDVDGNVKSYTDVLIPKATAVAILEARRNGEESEDLKALESKFSNIFKYSDNEFVNDHNIYGGGDLVSTVAGNSTVTINHGMLNDEIAYYDDDNWTLGSLLKQLVTGNNSHPQFSVFGGGYGIDATVNGNTTLNMQVGYDRDSNPATIDYAYQEADHATWDNLLRIDKDGEGKYIGTLGKEYENLTSQEKDAYYGGTSGSNGIYRYIASRLANIFSIPNHTFMNIIGGGMGGKVLGNTNVNLTNQSICQNVIGGGIGIIPDGRELDGTETYGMVGDPATANGTSTVTINSAVVMGNVYGGGAGVESYKKGDGTYIDFEKMGAVDKTTSVTIDGTPNGTIIFGKVFGGGDIADVTNSASADVASTVTIQGGCVYQQVFAGGSGVLKAESKDYTKLGKVAGNTKVTVKQGEISAPWLWNRVYGGGSYGSVTGNTTVEIQGGNLGYNIFGGGFGDVTITESGDTIITSSDVGGSTNINITGGEWCLSQMWDTVNRRWMPKTNASLSAQYDGEKRKFLINHNIYGGGNAASNVVGNTNITMTHGLLKGATALGHDDTGRTATSLFASDEWKGVYSKVGSFHFCIVGGGYGAQTAVDSTVVNINMAGTQELSVNDSESEGVLKTDLSGAFASEQSVLDVIGGGYNGIVRKGTNVTIQGDTYLRRAYGGSFYSDVNNTKMNIVSANVDNLFGGCMMGDIKTVARLNVGSPNASTNSKIFINHDIYGGNDVSGQINGLITVNVNGGKIYRNVYAAGNGDYLYALNEARTKVNTVEGYEAEGAKYDLVYEVPRREELMEGSASSATQAARLVNINSYRPQAQFVRLNVAGTASYPVTVVGNIFGGGNTATVNPLNGEAPRDTVNIGNYVTAKMVFMGSDGEAMFDETTNGFLNAFKRINSFNLADGINWANDPYSNSIPQKYLPFDTEERQKTFPHVIDLYFQPVEMSIQPVLMWNGVKADPDTYDGTLEGTVIGSFFCGGNRGNMDVKPGADGNAVNYIFPAGLTIKDKIVGGCNNANFIREDLGVVHQGGYLLGKSNTPKALINFKVKDCIIDVAGSDDGSKYTSGNIYGGCYKSGTISGDIHIDVHTNMLDGLDVAKLTAANDAGIAAGNVYGAGYGTDSYVYGNIYVAFGTSSVECTQATNESASLNLQFEKSDNVQNSLDVPVNEATDATVTYDDDGFSANSIFGGGQLGNVIGNTTVKILNGHLAGDVCGGSYAGTQYGSTHVLVGYPDYYVVKENCSGIYDIKRADKAEDNNALTNFDGSKTIKDKIRLIAGDVIAPAVYDSIYGVDKNACFTKYDYASASPVKTPLNWNNVRIQIDKAVYGGGYALSQGYSGSGGSAGTYTVKKYNKTYNVDNTMSSSDPLYNNSTIGYGGNSTVLVWDRVKAGDSDAAVDRDHITISNETADGGFYGGGHLSYSEGFRTGELRGYGYASHSVIKNSGVGKEEVNNAKVMNTIQRLDIMRLTDNCLILNGARDYTINEVSTTPYSISRVGELQMVSSIDANATLPTDSTSAKYRNYLGLMNNIHYVGAISSNALFTDKYHNARGVIISNDTTYMNKKQRYITDWYNYYNSLTPEQIADKAGDFNTRKSTFEERNDATAKNLIGLSSGYAMKVQNTKTRDAVGTDSLFYGPVVGVVEMKLILPIVDEGGGYVYADNVHDDPDNFLETTGNFVFPIKEGKAHYVVDDCLTTGFDELKSAGKTVGDSEMHYWYLAGINYVYNLHITGYTFNSASNPITFHANTSDGLTVLEGAEGSTGAHPLKITSVTWKTNEDCQFDDNDGCDILNGSRDYTLKLSASYSTYDSEDADVKNGKYKAGDVKTLYNEDGLHAVIQRNANRATELALTGTATFAGDPKLAICLVDAVDNAGPAYYAAHMAEPDTVKIVLSSGDGYKKTYTINLIINYVKGPSHTGNISIANCALPGEYIKVMKDDVTIDADPAFAQNGEFLHIGKLNDDKDNLVDGYLTYDASGNATSDILKGSVYSDPEGKYLMIPAYYFMNGYGVQYVYTCNNMDDGNGNYVPYSVAMQLDGEGHSKDTLVVHNYHQMRTRTIPNPIDLHLAEAVTRASQEPAFAQPRIYIKDEKDLIAFQEFIDTVGAPGHKVWLQGDSVTVPAAGQYAQFFIQKNITVQQTSAQADNYYKTPQTFKGTLHGDGYAITGVDGNLVGTLDGGNIYNLGMNTGTIAGAKANSGMIHTSYEYDNFKAYDMDGGEVTTYTEDDFKYGKVAYNLNQYYLEARKYLLDNSIVPDTLTYSQSATLAGQAAVAYLKNYYANGDYQYARRGPTGEDKSHSDGDEYLRNNDEPHYIADVLTDFDGYESFHNTLHPVDESRAVDKTKQGNYLPLFNAVKIDNAATVNVKKNDYVFFGQNLQATPEEHPATIASHEVANMTNRVYRASGFYRSHKDEGFHFNASKSAMYSTYVHDARTTAIDFTGMRDNQNSAETKSGWRNVTTDLNKQNVFYAPACDLPTAYYGLLMDEGITKNLLVYTDNATGTANSIANVANTTLNYGNETAESSIKGHRVEKAADAWTYTAARMHLVDKEDFNAPVTFTADTAWYVRNPDVETGYVEQAGSAWSSICLPFTVEKATLSSGLTRVKDAYDNGRIGAQQEITFFYGTADDVATNPHILNHEFWLRGLTAVAGDKATFKRPANGIDGKDQSGTAGPRAFAAYKPFIVSFPGDQFYEFSMKDQTISFGADNAEVKVTDVAVVDSATTANGYKHYGAYLNNNGETGAYAITVGGEGDRFVNGEAIYPFRSYLTKGSLLGGNSLDADFNLQSSMVNADYILINDDLSQKLEDVLDGDIERDPDGGVSTPSGLRVYGIGTRLVVVSDFATTLPVYTATGALVRVLDVRPGTATYSGFSQGIYIVDRKKIRLR